LARYSSIKVGDRFGRLLVIAQPPKDEYDSRSIKRTLFLCRCDCGTERLFDAGNLKKPSKSCGCIRREHAKQIGFARRTQAGFFNNYYGEYRRQARNRGIAFELSLVEFTALVKSDCRYCGAPPTLREKKTFTGLPAPVNGVDRTDSNVGYIAGNTVPCCQMCNLMKNHHPLELFISHCRKVAAYTQQLEIE
jgi:hypothetical protein